ncbi:FAD-dependent oxidoreductase [Chitinophaga sp. CF418]|uniref:FAD-dependent oxidoreductase n=1 Tax=Chitinophaga sp. CF418 TaxID=1855287 RepID=UPI000921E9A1|nr:FAD-dependent oxidoreductase [Chitinophaga sp. CF418]SHN41921.1 Phytoene dehydrogenase-related protein [Chitinophaga sp. CF418]
MTAINKFNAVIIGSGLGGLTAGATLAKLGKKVLVLEQHYIPGGCATNFKRKGFIMEVGLHEMNGFHDRDIKAEVFELLDVNKFIQFVPAPELFHVTSAATTFTFPHGTARAQQALIEKFPHEAKGIQAFFRLMNNVLDEIYRMPKEKWKMTLIYPFIPVLYSNIFKSLKLSCGDWLDKHITDEQLKLVLTTNVLYYGDDPYNLSLLHFAIAQAGYITGGGYYIKGGSQKLSDYLTSFIEKNGGQVMAGKKAENILVENDRATGVQYRDAFNDSLEPVTIYADAIVLNAAIPHAIKMLPEPYRQSLKEKTKNLETSCSLISIYMGFDIDLKQFGVQHYSTFIQGKGINQLKDIKANNIGDWGNKSFVFVDYSQLDSGITPAGKSFGVICAADYLSEWEGLDEPAYKNKKEQIAQLFLKRLETHYPGILQHIIFYEVGTAKTIQRYTLNPKGTPYGYAQSPSQSGVKRIPARSPLRNMYFASAWSFPGGGFTGSISGGYWAAMSMNKAIKWQTYNKQLLEDGRIVKLLTTQVIAENTIELTFEKPPGFYHKPGQYAILRLNKPKKIELDLPFRSLSIVSHPDEPILRFAMRVSDSSFKYSCLQMEAGDEATIFGPCGNFLLKPGMGHTVFLICGIGITPVLPILKELEKKQFKSRIYLFNSNRTIASTAYQRELENIKIENYTYLPVITSTSKRIDIDLLKYHLNDLLQYDYYLVGTSPFLASMKQLLTREEVPIDKIKMDDFG